MTTKKAKSKKMDRKLISSQPHELKTAAKRNKTTIKAVKAAKKSLPTPSGRPATSKKRIDAKLKNV